MLGAISRRRSHAVTLPGASALACGDASDIPNSLSEPQVPIRSWCDIGWAAVGCWRRKQGNRLIGSSDAPDSIRVRGEILVSEPEIPVRPFCDPAQVEVITILWAGKAELGNNACRGDTSDPGRVRAVEREPEIAIWPCSNVIGCA